MAHISQVQQNNKPITYVGRTWEYFVSHPSLVKQFTYDLFCDQVQFWVNPVKGFHQKLTTSKKNNKLMNK